MMAGVSAGGWCSQQMQFFNKYKDLFGVPQGLGVPTSRLHIDNQLFIQKPYVPTKTQEYSLNGKLKELRRDYNQFEHKIDQITRMRQTPKRTPSRKGSASRVRSPPYVQKYNQNKDLKLPLPAPPLIPQPKHTLDKEKKKLREDAIKRQGWFRQENNNILKHSELDHIFSNKLNSVYDIESIKQHNLPKPEINLGFAVEKRSPTNRPKDFTIKQRSKPQLQTKPGLDSNKSQSSNALARREKAKSNLEFRRKKLQQLLRTLW